MAQPGRPIRRPGLAYRVTRSEASRVPGLAGPRFRRPEVLPPARLAPDPSSPFRPAPGSWPWWVDKKFQPHSL